MSSDPVEFVVLDEWVLLEEFVLVLLLEVEVALVVLRVPVLSTENVLTLAGEPEKAYFLLAGPAGVLMGLHWLCWCSLNRWFVLLGNCDWYLLDADVIGD